MQPSIRDLRIALVGHGFMGAAHSHAWRAVSRAFDLGIRPVMSVVCGRDMAALHATAGRYGWTSVATDWTAVVESPDVDLVDICTPGNLHMPVAVAALRAGKHVLCEKPLGNSLAEAELMAREASLARARGQQSMVGFNYRRLPALALAHELVAEGRLGDIRLVRGTYLQSWLVDPEAPLSWRTSQQQAGSGALGDLGAHVIDLVHHLTGHRITDVAALTRTFIAERPVADASVTRSLREGRSSERGKVTVDDAVVALGQLDNGALVTLEATRMAPGRKNALRIELNGSEGSVWFDLEALNELWYFDGRDDSRLNGFRRIHATEPNHPYLSAWWPPGHGLGYDHSFVHEIGDLVRAIAGGHDAAPGFGEGLQVQRVLESIASSSSAAGTWTRVPVE